MVYTADIVGLLRTLAIFFLVYWGIKLFVRYVLPLLGIWAIKKAGKKFSEQAQEQQAQRTQRNGSENVIKDDGSVRITKSDNKYDSGDYVDYEEVD